MVIAVIPSLRAARAGTNRSHWPESGSATTVSCPPVTGLPSTAAQRRAAAGGSLTSIVSPVTPPPACSGARPVHDGPAHRHDSAGAAQSSDTMAPGTSLGCRWVAAMSGRSAVHTTRTPRPATLRRAAARSGTWKIAIYPPSPPRCSRYRPAVVPGRTGATTSTNVSPTANTALARPNRPTPGSQNGRAQPKARPSPAATRPQSRATRATWRKRGPVSTPQQ